MPAPLSPILGAKLAKCEMESGSWTQQASGECHPIPWTPEESECELPKKVNKKLQNGHWSCKTKLSNDYRLVLSILADYKLLTGYKLIL